MSTKNVLIVCDAENQQYWIALTNEIKEKIGPVRILLDNDISRRKIKHRYDAIVMDISDIDDLQRLIPKIHDEQPGSGIIIVSSTPTWKPTRAALLLGASNVIRKSSNLDELINELRKL